MIASRPWQAGKSAEAVKTVAACEDFFGDRFPQRPLMPGVSMVEEMIQLAGLLLKVGFCENYQCDAKGVLSLLERTKFRDMVRPGDTLQYCIEAAAISCDGAKARPSFS